LKSENQYIIHFKGLKEGEHDFEFAIGKPFFEEFEQLEIPEGKVNANIVLTRKPGFLEIEMALSGVVQVECDRCLSYFEMPLSYEGKLLVKFSETQKEEDADVLFLHPEDYALDLKHYMYECISLSLPFRKVHPDLPDGESGCDPDMIKKLKDHLVTD
jgi:uncharacterized metal-binding protein YceD (DUF177 family)